QLTNISIFEAMNSPVSDEWRAAIRCEFESLLKNDTWEIVDRPKNRKIVSCRLLLRDKFNVDGSVERRKARLVARGFSQQPGIDYGETFSPVARIASIRIVLAIAAKLELELHQVDVATAYLNGELEEEIFMNIPEMLPETLSEIAEKSKDNDFRQKARNMLRSMRDGNKVCLLNKALYG